MPQIDIVIKAIDEATTEIKKIAGGLGEAITEGAGDLQDSWNEYKGTIGQIYRASKGAYDQTVGVTIEYADQIERIRGYTGDTTENVSIMVQLASDFGVSVSDLETALSKMAKEGIDPSLDGLADIADRYIEINDPLDRTQYLTKLFGGNAADMAPLVSKGGDAIRELASAMNDDPPFTEEDQQAIEDYEEAVGNLNSALKNLKIDIGTKVIPVLTGLLTGWEKQRDELVLQTDSYDSYRAAMYVAGLELYMLTEEQYNAAKAAEDLDTATDPIPGQLDDIAGSADNASEALSRMPREVNITITETHRKILQTVEEYWSANQWVPEGHQHGGPVGAGRPYIVGEAGPELFVPQSSGQILPNHELGGVTINLTYAPGISFADSRELSTRLQPVIIQAVRDAKLRGGYPS